MMMSLEIKNDEHSYFLTVKDGRIWLENEEEESLVVPEMQLYQAIDNYFRKEL